MVKIYSQDGDTCEPEPQLLQIETEDGGAGKYFIIKTDRWAFDKISEIMSILKNFEKVSKDVK